MSHKSLRQEAVQSIEQSFFVLSNALDLSPRNDNVTQSLTRLVRTLTRCHAPALVDFLLGTPELEAERRNLPVLCGMAECEMEKYWARRLIASPTAELSDFWYYAEYKSLCEAECGLFSQRTFSKISFLGSGALPLTAFMLSQHAPQTPVTCIDFDAEACDLSSQLARKVGATQVTVECRDALTYTPQENELVICASLLQGRERVYANLEKHDCAMIVRDSEGIYQYLYKAAELPSRGFRQVGKTAINPQRINTSRYFEREAADDAA